VVGSHVMEGFEDFMSALESERPYESIKEVVKASLSADAAREDLRLRLEAFRTELRGAGRDADDDVVLEVLDDLTGWASPHRKL
jgi:hypothetical protein